MSGFGQPPGPPNQGGFGQPPGPQNAQNNPFGAPQPPHQGGYGAPPQRSSAQNEAIIALVLGIATMMTACFPLGFVGYYFGSKARKKALEEGDNSNATLALVGQILGAVFGGLWALLVIFYIGMMVFAFAMAASQGGM